MRPRNRAHYVEHRHVATLSGVTTPLTRTFLSMVRTAWSAPDRYAWFATYLAQRGLELLLRLMVAAVIAATSAVPLVMLASPSGAQTPFARVVAVSTSALGLLLAAGWIVRGVSTSRQSVLFIVLADVLITAGCATDSSSLMGLVGTTILAAIGGYAAFFHSARVLAAHLVWTLGVIAILIVATALDGDVAVALAKGTVVVVANLAVPLSCLFMIGMLGEDSEESVNDPLTGLVNRRGLERAVPALLLDARAHGDTVVVFAVDLDRFKRVNDHYGHDIGDRVLAETAIRLQALCTNGEIACRMGGEEFVLIGKMTVQSALDFAERIRATIATPNSGLAISASIGVACDTTTVADHPRGTQPTIDRLGRMADRAMYEAKRAGGDRVRLHSGALR